MRTQARVTRASPSPVAAAAMVHLYHHSLIPGAAVTAACVGNFSGTKQQEICVARGGQRIELLRTDPNTGKLDSLVEADVFGQIRSISAFKLTGGTKGQLQDWTCYPRPVNLACADSLR